MRHSTVAAVIAAFPSLAGAQMTLISAQRFAAATQDWFGDTGRDFHLSEEFGDWSEVASVAHAQARQNSSIQESGVTFSTYVAAGGGAGHHAAGECSLHLVFVVESPVRWDVTYHYNPFALFPEYRSLTREGDSTNLFADVDWYGRNGQPPAGGSGYLEPGRYDLRLNSVVSDGVWVYEDITFGVSVPAPSTLALLAAVPLTTRRRRRS